MSAVPDVCFVNRGVLALSFIGIPKGVDECDPLQEVILEFHVPEVFLESLQDPLNTMPREHWRRIYELYNEYPKDRDGSIHYKWTPINSRKSSQHER